MPRSNSPKLHRPMIPAAAAFDAIIILQSVYTSTLCFDLASHAPLPAPHAPNARSSRMSSLFRSLFSLFCPSAAAGFVQRSLLSGTHCPEEELANLTAHISQRHSSFSPYQSQPAVSPRDSSLPMICLCFAWPIRAANCNQASVVDVAAMFSPHTTLPHPSYSHYHIVPEPVAPTLLFSIQLSIAASNHSFPHHTS